MDCASLERIQKLKALEMEAKTTGKIVRDRVEKTRITGEKMKTGGNREIKTVIILWDEIIIITITRVIITILTEDLPE